LRPEIEKAELANNRKVVHFWIIGENNVGNGFTAFISHLAI
jgi:hypothetical protein